MLPMFEPKKIVSVISSKRGKPDLDVAAEVEAPGSKMDPGLKEAAEDLMRGLESKSVMDIASALKAAFECLEAAPHEEASQVERDDL